MDAQGKPVHGSIYYVEVRGYLDLKVYDFVYYRVNNAGEVPDKPLYVAFQLCKFVDGLLYAPGKVPAVFSSISTNIDEEGIVSPLQDPGKTFLTYNMKVFDFAFPFERRPDLRRRLFDKKYRPLREAFMAMYKQERLNSYEINAASIEKLRKNGVPSHIRKKIKDITGCCYKVDLFREIIEKALGKRDADRYYPYILSSVKKITDSYSNKELDKIRSLEKLEEEIRQSKEN